MPDSEECSSVVRVPMTDEILYWAMVSDQIIQRDTVLEKSFENR